MKLNTKAYFPWFLICKSAFTSCFWDMYGCFWPKKEYYTILLGFPEVICWKILSPQSPWLGRIMVCCFYIGYLVNFRPLVNNAIFETCISLTAFYWCFMIWHFTWIGFWLMCWIISQGHVPSIPSSALWSFTTWGAVLLGFAMFHYLLEHSIYLTSSSFRSESYLANTRC